ncbi:TPA: holin [Acinetobacter baumannii]
MGSIDLAFWVSIIIGLAGFLMNWYYAKKKNKRDEIALKAYLESLEKKGDCNVKQD